jgi:hypothetical protein
VKQHETLSGVPLEVIDFYSFSQQENVFVPEEIVRSKKYIKLDYSEEALFKSIDKIKITNDRIYILGPVAIRFNKLFVFNIDGSFIGTVGTRGQGPDEYLILADFDVDDSGNIYLVDAYMDKDQLFLFNSDFQFQTTKKLPFETDIIKCLSQNRLMFGLARWNEGENSPGIIAITNTDLETLDTFLTYDEYYDPNIQISSPEFVSTENEIFYNKTIDDNVYVFSPDGKLKKVYRFDFGKRSIPDEYKKDMEANWDRYKSYTCLKHFAVVTDNLGTHGEYDRIDCLMI